MRQAKGQQLATRFSIGDYVLATKWSDGDPRDPFAIGFVTSFHNETAEVEYNGQRRYFRNLKRISGKAGKWLVSQIPLISDKDGKSLWDLLEEFEAGNPTLKIAGFESRSLLLEECERIRERMNVLTAYQQTDEYSRLISDVRSCIENELLALTNCERAMNRRLGLAYDCSSGVVAKRIHRNRIRLTNAEYEAMNKHIDSCLAESDTNLKDIETIKGEAVSAYLATLPDKLPTTLGSWQLDIVKFVVPYGDYE